MVTGYVSKNLTEPTIAMPFIHGRAIVAEHSHNKHGSSAFVRDGLKVNIISVCEEDNIELITVEQPGVVVHSVNKPPASTWEQNHGSYCNW